MLSLFLLREDFVLVFSGREAPSGIQGFTPHLPEHSPEDPPILPINSATDPLFKNVKLNGTVVKSVDQLTKAGWDISVPMQFQ
jgi:hypothetical protein